MIKFATLIRVADTALSGRNRPIRGGIRAVTDQYHDAYLKPSGWRELTDSSVINEYVAICVAGLLGLPVCEPFWVECPDELKSFRPEGEVKSLGECSWPAFATCYAGPQWRNWMSTDSLNPDGMGEALAIFAFDGFLDNPDRRMINPNLLVKGHELRMIDHELVFSFANLIIRPVPPWTQNGLDWMIEGDRQHILYLALRECGSIDLNSIEQSWSALQDTDLDEIVNGLPMEFIPATSHATIAIQRVKAVRDNIEGCLAELERILS